jgi:hypothetical protein
MDYKLVTRLEEEVAKASPTVETMHDAVKEIRRLSFLVDFMYDAYKVGYIDGAHDARNNEVAEVEPNKRWGKP